MRKPKPQAETPQSQELRRYGDALTVLLSMEAAGPVLNWWRNQLLEASYPPPITAADQNGLRFDADPRETSYYEGKRAAYREILRMADKL